MLDDIGASSARKRLYFPDESQSNQASEYRSSSTVSVKYRRLNSIEIPSTPAKLGSIDPTNYELLEFHGSSQHRSSSSSSGSNVFQSIPHRVTTLLSSPPAINSSPYNKASYAGINRSIQAQIDALINSSYPQPSNEIDEQNEEKLEKRANSQLQRSHSHLLSLQMLRNGRAKIISPERTRNESQLYTPSIHLYTPIRTRPSTRARVRVCSSSKSKGKSSKGISIMKRRTPDLSARTFDMSYSRLTTTPRANKSQVKFQSSPFGFCMDFLFNDPASANTNSNNNDNIDSIFSDTGSSLQVQVQPRSSPNKLPNTPLFQQQQQQQQHEQEVDNLLKYISIDPLLQSEEGLMFSMREQAADIVTGESLMRGAQIQSPFISPPRTVNTSNFTRSNDVHHTVASHYNGFIQRTMGELLGSPDSNPNLPGSPRVGAHPEGYDLRASVEIQNNETFEPDAGVALRKLFFNT